MVDSLVKMDFHFPEELKERFLAALANFIDPDDRVWLKPLFEPKELKQRVRFNLKSNQPGDLFRRLVKIGILKPTNFFKFNICPQFLNFPLF